MDVQAESAGLTYDPSVTSVVQPNPAVQGTFFSDGSSYRTFADTDQIPIVQRDRRARRDRRDPEHPRQRGRWLGVLVVALALIVVLAGTALGLVQAGVIGNNGTPHATTTAGGSPPARGQRATTPHRTNLLTQTSTGAGTATYRISVPAYGLTVATTTGRSWVSVGVQGQRPLFAGIIDAHSSQRFTILGSAQVEVGAGGTIVTVTSNHHTQSLFPPSAPFSYTLSTS